MKSTQEKMDNAGSQDAAATKQSEDPNMRARKSAKSLLVFAAVCIPLILGRAQPSGSQIPPLYAVVDLGALTGESISFGRDINAFGQVVGRSGYITGSETRAVRWTTGGIELLGTLPGGDYSAAFGINDAGVVVGTSNTNVVGTSNSVVRAFRWTNSSGMQDLGTLPKDNGSEAFHVNNAGQVVGTSSGPKWVRAVLWKSDGRIQNLGTLPGGTSSRAVAVNDSGQVVGTSTSSSGTRAFLWTSSSGMQDLGTLPGHDSSEAFSINNSGQVVGYSSGPNGTRAFLWTSSAGMQDLGTLPGGTYSRAFGINNFGQVVGTSASSVGTRAFLWTSTGGMQDLNTMISALDLGLVLSEAHCINDVGQIAALSGGGEQAPTGDQDHEREHFYRVFLLTP